MWREENVKRSRCPEKETPKDKDAKRKRKAAETTSVSRYSDDIMSRARNVKEKDSQEITQSTAVPARGSGAVPISSPLSLLGFSLSRNFRHPACPGSTCIYIFIYIYIHIYIHTYIYIYLYHQAKIRDHGSSFQDLLRRKTANGNIGTALLRKVLSRIVRDPFVAV